MPRAKLQARPHAMKRGHRAVVHHTEGFDLEASIEDHRSAVVL